MSAPNLLAPLDAAPACCEDETWKAIPGWPHEASTCGQVRSTSRQDANGVWRLGGVLPQHPDKRPGKGYLYVHLRDGRRRRKAPVAVVVLEAHAGPRPGPEYEACHGNDVRTDNHRDNLTWDTKAANLARMWEMRRGERPVTGRALKRPGPVTDGAFPQDGASRTPSRHGVTGDGTHGTGSTRLLPSFPFVLPPVKPAVRAARTSSRAARAGRRVR